MKPIKLSGRMTESCGTDANDMQDVQPITTAQHTATCKGCKHSESSHRNGGCIACPCTKTFDSKAEKPCGCKIENYRDGYSLQRGSVHFIVYCPLHESAGEMLTLMKDYVKTVSPMEFVKHIGQIEARCLKLIQQIEAKHPEEGKL